MMALRHDIRGIRLSQLLQGIAPLNSEDDRQIHGICSDSRRVNAGDLFLAFPGARTSGARYVRDAIAKGAAAVVADFGDSPADERFGLPVIPVQGLAQKAGVIAARFHGEPTNDIRLVGVTGTNGKTSVSHYIAAALGPDRSGLIGTLGYGKPGALATGLLTTPDAVTLQQLLAGMRDQGLHTVAMEVSSHALRQGRVAGARFDIAVLTNLTRDHLDFHPDMRDYGAAKRLLFESPGLRHAVLNLDDDFGLELKAALSGRVPVTGYELVTRIGDADAGAVSGAVVEEGIGRLAMEIRSPWGRGRIDCGLTGRFNASNLLAAFAVLCLLDVPFERALSQLGKSAPVPGRMECFAKAGAPHVIVDYAHTPDALAQALATLRGKCSGRVICVFGCGGDRDPGKRPEMGAAAEAAADHVWVTSDNPRSEDPQRIIRDILAGMQKRVPVSVEADRTSAITGAIRSAVPGDVVLVAGKGHETYQEIGGVRYPFSDRQLVRTLLGDPA